MYARVHNITNVGGRKKYVKDKKNREEVVGFFQTTSDDFWKLLAQENQDQFRRSINSKNKNFKASEAREIVLGLPSDCIGNDMAKFIAANVKAKIGVECMVAIHKKYTRNEAGERVLNVHAHVIFAERKLLDKPIFVPEKRAGRNYYYDEKGKQCKKSEAVKVTKKGTITQEEHTRYFSNKINFHDFKSLEPLISEWAQQFNLEKFDIEKHFPQRKIGKNNPKEEFILEYNKLVKEMNLYFDEHASESSEASLKQIFCDEFNVPQRFAVNRAEEVRNLFEEFKASRERADELYIEHGNGENDSHDDRIKDTERMDEEAQKRLSEAEAELLYSELKHLKAEEKELEDDIQMVDFVLNSNSNDFVATLQARAYQNTIEDKYNVFLDSALLEYLREKLQDVKKNIAIIIEKIKTFAKPSEPENSKEQDDLEK